jgi:hypothetical protein
MPTGCKWPTHPLSDGAPSLSTGAHLLAHAGIANPIGCKCGPTTVTSELIELIKTLNPTNAPGKVVLISRFGASKVRSLCEFITISLLLGLKRTAYELGLLSCSLSMVLHSRSHRTGSVQSN